MLREDRCPQLGTTAALCVEVGLCHLQVIRYSSKNAGFPTQNEARQKKIAKYNSDQCLLFFPGTIKNEFTDLRMLSYSISKDCKET